MKKLVLLLAIVSMFFSGTSYAETINITTTTLQQSVEGNSYSAALASYPAGATWSGGNGLPAGLVLDSSGKITGHPTVAGDFPFSVTAKLGNASSSKTLNINISLLYYNDFRASQW